MTSTIRKKPTEIYDGGDNNKLYVKIIDIFYPIVQTRRKLDGFKLKFK